ncbi:Nif11-like leader peptide family RiPP precursor [Massilia solisilvae]|uniref:Nif11-like leader peptide family RiPP n=1 Tax=Massilia solisilvae TaxID=1811225 RepID=A0ABT2BRG3_9BURK|nr:Nif11-like leader peptide family RiPP precursor [Massilia solisilvae]MCS0611102.1 Nif11-like leader peptide family RiPP precursor [Massilia solisilvae]
MSIQNIEAFYKHALRNPALVNSLMGARDMPTFQRNVVELGRNAGFEFDEDEAHEWIQQKLATQATGELTDDELETVSGGNDEQAHHRFLTWLVSIGTVH